MFDALSSEQIILWLVTLIVMFTLVKVLDLGEDDEWINKDTNRYSCISYSIFYRVRMSEANLLTVTWLLGAVLTSAYALAIYIEHKGYWDERWTKSIRWRDG